MCDVRYTDSVGPFRLVVVVVLVERLAVCDLVAGVVGGFFGWVEAGAATR